MTEPSSHEVTQLLLAWSDGDQSALEKLTPLVYAELQNCEAAHAARGGKPHAASHRMVNEAYLRLIDEGVHSETGRTFSPSPRSLMRWIWWISRAVVKAQTRRGPQVPLDEAAGVAPERDTDLVALDEALEPGENRPPQSRIVELGFSPG